MISIYDDEDDDDGCDCDEDQDEHEGRDGTARVMTAGLARISVLAPRSMSIVEQLGRSAACQRRRSCDLTVLSSLRSVPDA